MRPSSLVFTAAALLVAGAAALADPAGELDAARTQCIALAAGVLQREADLAKIEHQIALIRSDEAARQRDLDTSRTEQEQLLGALEHLSRQPAPMPAVDRARGELLLKAALPGIKAEAKALGEEIAKVAALRHEIAAKEGDEATAQSALGAAREQLAAAVAQRRELTRAIRPDNKAEDAAAGKFGREAGDLGDLIRRADEAADRRDKERLAQAKKRNGKAAASDAADPLRPAAPHAPEPPQYALLVPVSGAINGQFGDLDAAGKPSDGIRFAAKVDDEVIAPFVGRVVYVGPAGGVPLVLIIRHPGGYHSVLAGLSRSEVVLDDWVLGGEPVGAVGAGGLYVELRRDDRPVDPQPWLARRDEGREQGRDAQIGDQRVRE